MRIIITKLSVVIPVKNEEEKLAKIITEVRKLEPFEIITVINGSSDKSEEIAHSLDCKVITYEDSLGHDIGRAVGAYYAKGDILLYLDGDIIISHFELWPFVEAIQQGNDIALNNLESIMESSQRPHSVSIVKKTVNDLFGYSDLSINSLVAVPHALSKHALMEINWRNLANPPLAQAIAMNKKLSIVSPAFVDVISGNKIRPEIHIEKSKESPYSPIEDVIFGDHLSAIQYLLTEKGKRGGYPDKDNRKMIHNVKRPNNNTAVSRSAVICDSGNQNLKKLLEIIQSLKSANVEEIMIVSSKQDLERINKLQFLDVKYIPLCMEGDIFLKRAIGAGLSNGEVVLFTDENKDWTFRELESFYLTAEKEADVVVYDEAHYLDEVQPIDDLNCMKYFLNLIVKRPGLWNNGLTNNPLIMNRKCLHLIGYSSLIIPPLAFVRMIENNLSIATIPFVQNRTTSVFDQNQEMMIGDYIEALSYLLSKTNHRGNFSDGNKKIKALDDLSDMNERDNQKLLLEKSNSFIDETNK